MPEWKLAVPKPGGSIPEGLLNKVMVGLATALVLALIISAGFCGGTDDDAESEEAGEPTEGAGIRPGAPVEDELQMVIDREERRIADAQRAAAAALLEAERLEELDRLAQLEADQASGFGNIPPEMRQALIDSLGILPDPELIELQRQARLENAARRITSLRANPVALSFRDGRGSGEATTRGRETGGNPSQADLLRALGNAGIQLPQAAGGAPPPGELDIPLPGSSRLPDYANPPRLLTPNDPPGWERVYEGQWLEAVLVTQLSGEFPGLEAAPADAAVSIDTQHLADHTAELADLDWKERGGRSFTPWNADVQDRLTRLAIPQTHHESPIERAAPRDLVDRVLAVERWYKNDWSALDTKLRTSIVEGISVFLAMFDLPDVARVFCPSPPPDPRNTTVEPVAGPYSTAGGLPVLEALPSLETLIEDGKVLAFNMPAGASPALARAAGVLLKNAWLQALLKRPAAMARAPGRYFRPAVFRVRRVPGFRDRWRGRPERRREGFRAHSPMSLYPHRGNAERFVPAVRSPGTGRLAHSHPDAPDTHLPFPFRLVQRGAGVGNVRQDPSFLRLLVLLRTGQGWPLSDIRPPRAVAGAALEPRRATARPETPSSIREPSPASTTARPSVSPMTA